MNQIKKRLLVAAVLIVLSFVGTVLTTDAPLHFAVIMAVLFLVSSCLRLTVRGWFSVLTMTAFSCGTALLTVLLCQAVNNFRGRPSSEWLIILGCLCFLFALAVLQLILQLFFRVSVRPALIVLTAAVLTLAVANRYTYEFRGTALTPVDLLSAGTAFNVAGNYSFSFDKNIWYAIILFAVILFSSTCIRIESFPKLSLRRTAAALTALLLGITVHISLGKVTPAWWGNDGVYFNGLLVNFARQLRESGVKRPNSYDAAQIKDLEEVYADDGASSSLPDPMPHIIVVMNESLADFRVFGPLETDIPVTPFLDSLQDNTIRGFAMSSVYGGGTPNSEYEFLTGNSMALFGPSTVSFTNVKRPVYTLERYLEGLGYDCWATHPEDAKNWSRQSVYPLLGFSDTSFGDDYPNAERITSWVRDTEVYARLIREFEASDAGTPRFLFAVTSQNHSPFGVEGELPNPIKIAGIDNEAASAYLTRLHESDLAFRGLIDYFKDVEEPVVILLYGDHHPKEDTEVIEALHGGPLEGDDFQTRYQIPYYIWANYDIEEACPPLTSINYLSNDLLEAAGLPLPPYNRYLKIVRQTIPALNAYGYYSKEQGHFLSFDEASGHEQQVLTEYLSMQYNAACDKKGRNNFFFPISD